MSWFSEQAARGKGGGGWNKGKSKYASKDERDAVYAARRRERRSKDREHENALARARRARDPERHREWQREYAKRPEQQAKRKEYRETHMDSLNAARMDWRQRNRAKVKAQEIRLHNRALDQMKADPDHPKHGTRLGYKHGCRCDRCKKASHDYMAAYYARKKAANG